MRLKPLKTHQTVINRQFQSFFRSHPFFNQNIGGWDADNVTNRLFARYVLSSSSDHHQIVIHQLYYDNTYWGATAFDNCGRNSFPWIMVWHVSSILSYQCLPYMKWMSLHFVSWGKRPIRHETKRWFLDFKKRMSNATRYNSEESFFLFETSFSIIGLIDIVERVVASFISDSIWLVWCSFVKT